MEITSSEGLRISALRNNTIAEKRSSWPFLLELDDGTKQKELISLLGRKCKQSGFDVEEHEDLGVVTVRQPAEYAQLFASHAADKMLEGNDSKKTFSKELSEPDFLLSSEAVKLTLLQLESIKIDQDAAETLKRLYGDKEANKYAPLGGQLLAALKTLGGVVSAFPMHEQARASEVWKSSRFQLLPSPDLYREYFGDGVGFYVAWMRHYTIWLLLPAILGLSAASYHVLGANQGITVDQNPYMPFYAVFMVVWGAAFTKFWHRTCANLQIRWHGEVATVETMAASLSRRAQRPRRAGFQGTMAENPVTGDQELFYPKWKRQLKMCVSFAVTVGMLAVAFAVMICSLNLQGYVRRKNAAYLHINTFAQLSHPGRLFDPNGWLFFVPGITHAISIMILNNVYRMIATKLTEWENHETDEEAETSLLAKRFAFEAFDCYIALVYLAFVERDVDLVRSELISLYTADCIRRLIVEAVIPAVTQWVQSLRAKKRAAEEKHADRDKPQSLSVVAENLRKSEYEAFDDYLEMVIQFGYITMFAAAFPSAAAISVIYNVIELKSDTFKLCWLYRRAQAHPANGIGGWGTVLLIQTWLAVFTNLAIFGFSSEQMAQWIPSFFVEDADDHVAVAEGRGRWVVTLLAGMEHVLVAIMVMVLFFVPDVPYSVQLQIARKRYSQRRCRDQELQEKINATAQG